MTSIRAVRQDFLKLTKRNESHTFMAVGERRAGDRPARLASWGVAALADVEVRVASSRTYLSRAIVYRFFLGALLRVLPV